MTTNQCDPRALLLAQELHQAEQPDITILFGSRARGDYREGQSDIDIMLVQEQPPSPEQQASAEHTARRCAAAQYDQPTPVQIVWQTQAEFKKMRRTINHVVANALRDGITMPRNPEEYGYDHNDDYEYEWTVTDERYRHAENHIHAFDALIAAGADDTMIGQHAHGAMEHALKALISANGAEYPHLHDINLLTHDALVADPSFDFNPTLDGSIYDQYAGDQEYRPTGTPISNIEHYQNIVNSDVQAILDRVQELRPPSSE